MVAEVKSCDFEYEVNDSVKLKVDGRSLRATILRITHTGLNVSSVVIKSLKGELIYLSVKKFIESVGITPVTETEQPLSE